MYTSEKIGFWLLESCKSRSELPKPYVNLLRFHIMDKEMFRNIINDYQLEIIKLYFWFIVDISLSKIIKILFADFFFI